MRLNLGCGREKLQNFTNVDLAINKPDVVLDLDTATLDEWVEAFGIDSVEYAQFIHVLEHMHNTLQVMENLWHVCKQDAIVYVRIPHGASDDAWEDPTHVRPYFPGSFLAYSQPYYWRADYGYKGDFEVLKIDLLATFPQMAQNPNYAMLSRNSIREMVVTMKVVKPARAPDRELMDTIVPQVKAG